MSRHPIGNWKTPAGWRAADGCIILGCGRNGIARGMCWNHYQRARRGEAVFVHLKPNKMGTGLTAAHFGPALPSRRVRRMAWIAWEVASAWTGEPTTGCWIWMGEYYPSGYGRIGTADDPWGGYAHRAVLYFAGQQLPREDAHYHHVRHLCDQPACVNPAHLRYGTAKENMADRAARMKREGRVPWAHLCARRKLTPTIVTYIREAVAAGATRAELSADLGLGVSTIYSALQRTA